ncbi:alpha-hydroxy-acid oxidizing protein [Roseovarius sp. ZX-A-9]|uniref:alpha-hydroxy-acid oxidizing protein n=1 Tax=Roseovarius sp. ZX-A-9 TaxID=3014783 RepID=UPI00232E5111|nr:alpha-hydroxy-acid oxidizing protein [Roseovarius sp. ZX-A-9]
METELRSTVTCRISTASAVREQHGNALTWGVNQPPDLVAFVTSTQEVAQIVRLAASHSVPVASVANRFGEQCEIFLDSGFRRGSDIAKALSLGAKGAFFGRTTLYDLAAGGQAGVEMALQMLSDELETCMGQIGCARIADLEQATTVQNAPSSAPS